MKKKQVRSTERAFPATAGKRIVFVCFSRSLGGLELTTLRLAKAIGEKGNTVKIVVPPSSPLHQRALESGLSVEPIEPRLKYGDVSAVYRLSRILRNNKIEVVVLMQSKDIHLASLATLFTGSTKSLFYQQMDSGYDKRDFLHRWVHSRLSLWVTLTESMKANVLTFTSMPGQSVKVVPLGIDLEHFDPAQYSMSSARRYFQLPQKGRLVGVLGRLDPQKGQEVVLRSLPELLKKHPAVSVIFAGDETAGEPGYRSHLEDVCNTLGIRDHVIFLPFTEDVPRLMAALDLFVLPSYCETYGLVVIEAMAMNRPVVATNAGGVPEIIKDGKTGILVEPRDSDELRQAIHRLLTSAPLRSGLVRAARQEVIRRFDFGQTVDQFLRFITAL